MATSPYKEKERSYHIYFFAGEYIMNVVAKGVQNFNGLVCIADMDHSIYVSVREGTTVEMRDGYVWLSNKEVGL